MKTEKNVYHKQFGFSNRPLTEHAIVKLANQIDKSFERNHCNDYWIILQKNLLFLKKNIL